MMFENMKAESPDILKLEAKTAPVESSPWALRSACTRFHRMLPTATLCPAVPSRRLKADSAFYPHEVGNTASPICCKESTGMQQFHIQWRFSQANSTSRGQGRPHVLM